MQLRPSVSTHLELGRMRSEYQYRLARREAEINAQHDRAMPMAFTFPSQYEYHRQRVIDEREAVIREEIQRRAQANALMRAYDIRKYYRK